MLLPAILTVHAITRRGGAELRPSAGAMSLRRPVGRLHRRARLAIDGARRTWRLRPADDARRVVNYSRGLTGVLGLVPSRSTVATACQLVRGAPADRGDRRVALDLVGHVPACWPGSRSRRLQRAVRIRNQSRADVLVGIGAALMLAGASVALLDLAARPRGEAAATPAVAAFSALASRRSWR